MSVRPKVGPEDLSQTKEMKAVEIVYQLEYHYHEYHRRHRRSQTKENKELKSSSS